MTTRPTCCLILLLTLPTALLRAESSWTLTDDQFRQQSVNFVGMDGRGIYVGPGRTLIPHSRFLELARPAAASDSAERFVLHLAGGDVLRGEPVGTVREQLQWKSASLGQMQLSLRDVRAIVRGGRAPEGIGQEHKEDVVVLTNGDSVRGIISKIEGGKVYLSDVDNGIAVDAVAWIFFASPAQKPPPATRAFRVKLIDGSVFTAPEAEAAGDQLTLKLSASQARSVPLASVVSIEQMNGPVSWLSSRQPLSIQQVPFLDENFPPRMDRTVADKPIRFGRQVYTRGIGVHARCVIEYALDGGYDTFRTQYAIDEGRNERADVTVRIKLDDKVVHEKLSVRAGVLSEVVQIPLGSASKLTLEVDFGQGIHTQDRLNWIEPALVRKAAGAAPSTRPAR